MKATLSLLSILLTGSMAARAQTDVTNTGMLFVSNAADTFYVTGSFANGNTSGLTNNGNLYVKQHLSNAQASMAVGTGTLFLNGTANQNINGTEIFKTFNLVTNNAGGITLNNNLSVTSVHTFSSGIISISATPNYLLYEAGSSYTGDGDTKHVNGWVRKSGTTNFAFPVGNGTVERKIGVSSLSVASVFEAKYMGTTTNPSNLQSPLVTVDPNEFWTLNKISGGTGKVDMNWDNSKVPMPNYRLADIRVANYIAAKWTAVGSGAVGNLPTTGTISSNILSSFGPFVLGSISMIVPMHLLSFTAQKSPNAVLVQWMTTDEKNVSHYEVLKSDDGVNFRTLGRVAAANEPGIQKYAFTDSDKPEDVTYYRLKSIDLDGKYSLSKIVTVSNSSDQQLLSVVNPAHGFISMNAENIRGRFQYRIVNSAGIAVQQGTVDISGTHAEIRLTPAAKTGVYTLMLSSATYTTNRRLLID